MEHVYLADLSCCSYVTSYWVKHIGNIKEAPKPELVIYSE